MATELNVRVLVAERTLNLQLPSDTTVGALRRTISLHPDAREAANNKVVKIISRGRLLQDNNITISAAGLVDGDTIHVALTERQIPEVVVVDAPAQAAAEAQGERLGFDRLSILGLDSEDISVLRSQFLPEVQRDFAHLPLDAGETEAHRLLRMEDEWLRVQPDNSDFIQNLRPLLEARRGGASGFRGSLFGGPSGGLRLYNPADGSASSMNGPPQGSFGTFLFGMLLGMWGSAFIFVMIFMLASSQFSTRFKLGLVTGIMASAVITIAADGAAREDEKGGGSGSGGSGWSPGGGGGGSGGGGGGGGVVPGPGAPLVPVDIDTLGGR